MAGSLPVPAQLHGRVANPIIFPAPAWPGPARPGVGPARWSAPGALTALLIPRKEPP